MTAERLLARRAIEALRAGVATPSVVKTLGTSHVELERRVLEDLDACAERKAVTPLVIVGGFGCGKTHMLNYIAAKASEEGFVTSYVVASPETPPGNLHVVLKAIAAAAKAPGFTGRALRELMAKYGSKSKGFAEVRRWAQESEDIHDRFVAMLHLYEEFSSDPEFQVKILDDFEGNPMLKTEIKSRLKEIRQIQGYDLSHPRNRFLAPERILLLAQLFRACDCKGWVVMFDELERLASFSRKQRIEAYGAIGWWTRKAKKGLGIYPVFAFVPGAIDEVWRKYQDHHYLDEPVTGSPFAGQEDYARAGLELLKEHREFLDVPNDHQLERTFYALGDLYARAYDCFPVESGTAVRPVGVVSFRSQIRRWITEWDLRRLYGATPEIVDEGLDMDTREVSDDVIATGDDSEALTE